MLIALPGVTAAAGGGGGGSPPTAPSEFSAVSGGATAIDLSWQDNSGDETGFRIYRSASSGSGFTELATVSAGVTTYEDTGLSPEATWYYYVTAYNGAGESAATAEDAATTDGEPPNAPSGLAVVTTGSTTISVNAWTSAASAHKIYRSTSSGTGYAEIASGIGSPPYGDGSLTPETAYYYVITAYNAWGESGYSNEANATTDA